MKLTPHNIPQQRKFLGSIVVLDDKQSYVNLWRKYNTLLSTFLLWYQCCYSSLAALSWPRGVSGAPIAFFHM